MPTALIVHSTCGLTDALKELLGCHYTVELCHSRGQAQALLRQHAPEVLVLYLSLPEGDGLTLLKEAAGKAGYTVVLTNVVTDIMVQELELLQVDEVLLVPCDVRKLAARLNALADENAPAQKA